MRFRIEVKPVGDAWEATVYDLADHGPDTPYARVFCSTLEHAMREASHYVVIAADDDEDPWMRRAPRLQAMTPSRAAGCTCRWSDETGLDVVSPTCPVAERHIP